MTSAAVDVYDNKHQKVRCRVLLDTCATANFITETLATTLRLPKKKLSLPVGTLNSMATTTKHVVTATIKSIHNGFERTLTFLTIPCISEPIPAESFPKESINIPPNIRLADPDFYKSTPVDLLIGSGPTLSLFSIGQINLSNNGADLILQKTRLGWVIGGSVMSRRTPTLSCFLSNLQQEITKFWELEEGTLCEQLSEEQLECEQHFRKHVNRDASGRYVVALPFKHEHAALGESRGRAINRLNSLRRKFKSDPLLQQQYTAVIEEYLHLGHMSDSNEDNGEGFYLPHHAVVKESSNTTKVRVVFDGSAKSSTGISLNDALMIGPTIQDDLFSLILRFRLHNYVITADIEKMYRQILVRPEDRKYQRIVWQTQTTRKTYELNTVTFGLASAPYLAIRCLHQLADDEGHWYPAAAKCLKRDMYVDDLLTGAPTIEETKQLRRDIFKLLELGGLRLRQWASNDTRILDDIPTDDLNQTLQLDKDQPLKTLGVIWSSKQDAIRYTVKPIAAGPTITKRKILSEIAKIFDPLGLLGPVILYAKCLMQKIWLLKLEWDESVTHSIHSDWTIFCEELGSLNTWHCDRRILIPEATDIELHGFCDASEKGYGACIYIRSRDSAGNIQCKLLCSRSRVAPLKTVTIPRLELCAVQLLSKLYQQIKKSLECNIDKTYLWTDSMIALHWINTPPHILKTFVGNRVSDIQRKTDVKDWRHVRSEDNPADQLSRGQLPREFTQNSLWLTGPLWLKDNETEWPKTVIRIPEDFSERKRVSCFITTTDCDLLYKFSSYNKLIRIIAYCLRVLPKNTDTGPLKGEELNSAEMKVIKLVQAYAFHEEMQELNGHRRIRDKGKLKSLSPFMDKDGIIRVGGRLKNAQLPYEQQHPAILPQSHHVTDLIIRHHHQQNHHSGIQTTLYSIRRQFWLIDGRNRVRKIIRSCVRCCRVDPPSIEYAMGNLPRIRTTQARPFSNVGVDYCGPFFIKERKHRNRTKIKIYIAVFVCMVVKAVHLEIVSDLTTEGFLGALRRFISRRGKPQTISSDNGTNFVGANNELKELYALFNSKTHQAKTTVYLGEQGIKWRFIPPLSPNFGGLWEATVKVFKHHLKRVMINELFTFEEFNTLAIEIEAILNSRPLTPLSTDPNDFIALTPGHFLIGDSLTSLPSPDYSAMPINRLSRWQHLQKIQRDFWARWSKEYLNELNIRSKWTKGAPSIKEDAIVLLKEDHLPPTQWSMGRVIALHPGTDDIVRVVTVKTSKEGPIFTAPISNVTVPVGREAMLACVVEDLSNYKVAWLRVNTQTILTIANHVITKNHRIAVTHTDRRTWYLHIKDVKESDQGDYMCQINTDPMKSQIGYLEVVVPPDILDYPTSTDMVVREGSNVTFRCAATGSPPPNITWRREGGELIPLGTGAEVTNVDGSVFNITRVNRLHMGAYLCIASNGVPPTVSKRIALIVHFQPMIMIPNQLVGAQDGQTMTLECNSEAYPQSINYWTRENREIVPNGKRVIPSNFCVDAYKIQMKLTIHNVIITDYGFYKCISNNSLGHTNGQIKLYRIPPPTTLPPPTTTTPVPTVIKVEKKPRSRQKLIPSVAPSSNEIIDASQSTVNQKDAELRSRSTNNGGHVSASAVGNTDRNNNNKNLNDQRDEMHRTDKTAQSMSSMSTSPISIVNTNVFASFAVILLTALS